MPHARAARVADRQDCPEPQAPGDPHQQLAARPAPSPAGYPPAQISQIRTATAGAAIAKPSTQ
jgi:hypothetical protein